MLFRALTVVLARQGRVRKQRQKCRNIALRHVHTTPSPQHLSAPTQHDRRHTTIACCGANHGLPPVLPHMTRPLVHVDAGSKRERLHGAGMRHKPCMLRHSRMGGPLLSHELRASFT